jgi:hypothetical protein
MPFSPLVFLMLSSKAGCGLLRPTCDGRATWIDSEAEDKEIIH